MEQLRRRFPHIGDFLLNMVLETNNSPNYINMVTRLNEDVDSLIASRVNIDDPQTYGSSSRRARSNVAVSLGYIRDSSLDRLYRPTHNTTLTTTTATTTEIPYYSTDVTKAFKMTEYVKDEDPVSKNNIIDYYYKCANGHAFEMQTIEQCKYNIVNSCQKCKVCQATINPELYKQPEVLSDIKSYIFDELLITNGEYDPERIEVMKELLTQLTFVSTSSIEIEIDYYAKEIENGGS